MLGADNPVRAQRFDAQSMVSALECLYRRAIGV